MITQYAAIQRYKAAKANYIAFNEVIKEIKTLRINLKKTHTKRSWWHAWWFVFEKKGRCVYCKKWAKMTKEHLIPRSYGGTFTVDACRECNNARGNSLSYEPFVSYCVLHPRVYTHAVSKLIPL